MRAARQQPASWPRLVLEKSYSDSVVRFEVDVDGEVALLRTITRERTPDGEFGWLGGLLRFNGETVAETEVALELPAARELLAVLAEAIVILIADGAGKADAPSSRQAPAPSDTPTLVISTPDTGQLDDRGHSVHWPFRGERRIGRHRG